MQDFDLISLEDAAAHLRIDPNEPRLKTMIKAAVLHVECFLNKKIFPDVEALNEAVFLCLVQRDNAIILDDLIKQAILLIVGDFYENRENSSAGELSNVPLSMQYLLAPYRGGLGF